MMCNQNYTTEIKLFKDLNTSHMKASKQAIDKRKFLFPLEKFFRAFVAIIYLCVVVAVIYFGCGTYIIVRKHSSGTYFFEPLLLFEFDYFSAHFNYRGSFLGKVF